MIHVKTEIEPSKEHRVVDFQECDVCHCKLEEQHGYAKNVVRIYHRKGDDFPEGDQTKYKKVDMCDKCFNSIVVPFIESLGAIFQEIDGDDWCGWDPWP